MCYKFTYENIFSERKMKSDLNLLALEVGAKTGACYAGNFNGRNISINKLHGFFTEQTDLCGIKYWNIFGLIGEIQNSIKKFIRYKAGDISGFGVNMFGSDFGLIDANGALLGVPQSFLKPEKQDLGSVYAKIHPSELFARTGSAGSYYNSVFELDRRVASGDIALKNTENLLFLPDLISYFLTGEKGCEYTYAATSLLLSIKTKEWDKRILERLSIPESILQKPEQPGRIRGELLQCIAQPLAVSSFPVISVASHSTASAAIATPAKKGTLFICGKAWSLIGFQTETPVLTDEAYDARIVYEGGAFGKFNAVTAVPGIGLLQSYISELILEGEEITLEEMAAKAEEEEEFCSVVNFSHREFFNKGRLFEAVKKFCKISNQVVPETKGELAKCVFLSLALKIKSAVAELEKIRGEKTENIYLTDKAAQSDYFCRLIADATGAMVTAKCHGGAALGNLIMQCTALGEIKGETEAKEIAETSGEEKVYLPKETEKFESLFEIYKKIYDIDI